MKPMEIETKVAAPADRVWEIITNLERSPDFISAIDHVERLDPGSDFGVGTRWRETRTIFGKEATEELEITAVEPGRSYVVEADSHGAHYRSVMGVDPVSEVESRLWLTFDARPVTFVGKLMHVTIGRLFRGSTRKMLAKDLEDIARAAELERTS